MLSPNARMAIAFLTGGIYIGIIVGVPVGAFLDVMFTLAAT